jgi:Flp pilus assembly protein TadD
MRKSIEMAPKRPGAYFSLATLLLLWGRNLPEARTLCQELVALEPTARNYALLAEACKRNEDIAGARAALERAMELDPGNQDFKGAYKALSERK